MARSRSNSVKTSVEASPLAINAGHDWSAREQVDDRFGSVHTLATIKGGFSRSRSASPSSLADTAEADERTNAAPDFVIDVPSEESHPFAGERSSSGRTRSDTFGGVSLPTHAVSTSAPDTTPLDEAAISRLTPPSTPQSSRPPNRHRSVSNASSISLHLGGGKSWLPEPVEAFRERRPVLFAGLQAGSLFVLSILGLWALMHALLPPIDAEHRDKLKLPKNFDDLQALNEVLQVYKERHWWRVLGSFSTVYLFLQAFSIPGSMYLSILGGALYKYWALPLVMALVATGALVCYGISAALGPALLMNSDKWRAKVEAWTDRIASHGDNLIPYLIVLRIAPLPPHWTVNLLAPHLGISVWVFWVSTFLGIGGVSYIHVTIGTTLDQMASSDDFHIISWQNGVGLGGICLAVLVPVMIKKYYAKDIADAAEAAVVDENTPVEARHSGQYSRLPQHAPGQLEMLPDSDEELSPGVAPRRFEWDGEAGASSRQEARAKGEGGSLAKVAKILGVNVQRGSQ